MGRIVERPPSERMQLGLDSMRKQVDDDRLALDECSPNELDEG